MDALIHPTILCLAEAHKDHSSLIIKSNLREKIYPEQGAPHLLAINASYYTLSRLAYIHHSVNKGQFPLSRLTAAIEAEKASPLVMNNYADERVVGKTNRALPLINLLAAAAKANANVMWK